MGRGPAARRRARGGGSIQASSQVLARVAAAAASLAGAAGIAAAVTLSAHVHRTELAALGLSAVVALALGVAWPLPSLLPWPLVLLAGAYIWRLGGGHLDEWAPVYAGGFLAVAELAYWSVELRGRAHDAERLTERRAAHIATYALVAVAAGGGILAATSLRIGSGVATDVLGAVAAVGALALVATLARSGPR